MFLRLFLGAAFALPATAALAQGMSLDGLLPAGSGTASGKIVQLIALMTVLSLAPALLMMLTSFTRFVIAFSFLRSSLGLQSTPANLILISLSLFMTFFVMAPTLDKAWQDGVRPLTENRISEAEAYDRVSQPFREFMLQHVRAKDLQMMTDLAHTRVGGPTSGKSQTPPAGAGAGPAPEEKANEKIDMRVLVPAFMISELRRGFEIGFLIALPFLVIDIIVAALVMSMGMMMMPPTVIALPFKVLFFVLIDGWNLVVSSLVRSYF